MFGSRRARVRLGLSEERNGSPSRLIDSYQGQQFSLSAGAMENGGDPPGTRRSASGRLITASTGRFMADPNKVKKTQSTKRANSRRSVPASENPADRSRSLGEVSDGEQNQRRENQVPRTTLPDSAIPNIRHRLTRKTSMGVSTRVTEREEYDQVQAQLRKGDPIRLGPMGRPQERSPNGSIPPLLSYLTQGGEESVELQTPRGQSAISCNQVPCKVEAEQLQEK
eukprot:4734015-Amphidinium_carterae.1